MIPRALIAAVALAVAPAGAAFAQQADNTPVQVAITRGDPTATQRLMLPIGKSAVIDLPVDVRDIVLGNPEVAEAVVRTSRRAYIMGLKPGATNAFFMDAYGRQILNLELRIERDTTQLEQLIGRVAPDARVKVETMEDSIVLSGSVRTASDLDRITQVTNRFIGGAEKVVNLVSLEGSDQVMLKVRVVEMQRTLIKQLGINVNAENLLNKLIPDDAFIRLATSNGFPVSGSILGGLNITGGWQSTLVQPQSFSFGSLESPLGPDYFANAGAIPPGLGAGVGGFSRAFDEATGRTTYTFGPGQLVAEDRVDGAIQAFERVGVLRTLAEPNLTAVSGETAKFLAGGEFPVPVAQEGNKISVEFKPFGVGLAFTPMVLSPGRISLKVSTEVSEISPQNSFNQGDQIIRDAAGNVTNIIRGISISGISVRRAESVIEAPSGGSIVMAGLIQQRTRQAMEGLPGAKDLPILGALFRSRDFQNDETELVVIITPYLVNPTQLANLRTPADGFAPATDAESLLLGRVNRLYKPPGADTGGRRWLGPIGHILN
jgi:pilus assembly protein CpaC